MLALAVEEQVNLDGPSLNIVLLDDHPEVRMITVGLLEEMGTWCFRPSRVPRRSTGRVPPTCGSTFCSAITPCLISAGPNW